MNSATLPNIQNENDEPVWTLVGHVSVDAGCLMLTDPCCFGDRNLPGGHNWSGFCDSFGLNGIMELNHESGAAGLAVITETGAGDGFYPVHVRRDTSGRVAEVRVKFD